MIRADVIPHKSQRYPTVGDWKIGKKNLVIRISNMKNPDYIFLVFLHEVIEAWLCFRRGIRERDVTRFDVHFERDRKKGDLSEPGDDPMAPYFREHQFATLMEKQMAKELGVDWKAYDRTVSEL